MQNQNKCDIFLNDRKPSIIKFQTAAIVVLILAILITCTACNLGAKYNSYILPESNKRKLTYADLADLSIEELTFASLEILARHRYNFAGSDYGKDDSFVAKYFRNEKWYHPDVNQNAPTYDLQESVSDETERYNLELIGYVLCGLTNYFDPDIYECVSRIDDVEKELDWLHSRAESGERPNKFEGSWYSRDGRIMFTFDSSPRINNDDESFSVFNTFHITDLDQSEYELSQGYQTIQTADHYKIFNSNKIMLILSDSAEFSYSVNGLDLDFHGFCLPSEDKKYYYSYEFVGDNQLRLYVDSGTDFCDELGEEINLFRDY